MNRGFTLVAIVGACLASAIGVGADTLVMRNGQRVDGRLVSVRNGTIEFEERGWRPRLVRVDQSEVRRIEFDDRDDTDGRPDWDSGGRPGLREREVIVQARQRWTDTGIDVRAGQSVSFRAAGEVRCGPSRRDGPAGERNSPRNPERPLPTRPAAALVGRLDSDVFFIGDDSSPIRVRGGGRLYLGINDDYLEDNSGSFRVTVYY